MKHHCPGTPCILVGTKSDLKKDPKFAGAVVSKEQAESLKNELKLQASLECSALTQDGLREVFDDAARCAVGSVQATENTATPAAQASNKTESGSRERSATETPIRKKRGRCEII